MLALARLNFVAIGRSANQIVIAPRKARVSRGHLHVRIYDTGLVIVFMLLQSLDDAKAQHGETEEP